MLTQAHSKGKQSFMDTCPGPACSPLGPEVLPETCESFYKGVFHLLATPRQTRFNPIHEFDMVPDFAHFCAAFPGNEFQFLTMPVVRRVCEWQASWNFNKTNIQKGSA